MIPSTNGADAITIIIFGASGDLTKRKLIPALFTLYKKKRLPRFFRVIGFARHEYSESAFREHLHQSTQEFAAETFDEKIWQQFKSNLTYTQGNFEEKESYSILKQLLKDDVQKEHRILFYLATPPSFYSKIIEHLGHSVLASMNKKLSRIVIEKPFGRDLKSAQELNQQAHTVFQEDQVFRIDHYLGKETAQNILFFRFGNTFLEPVWNRNYIDHVQITVAETVDVGHRAGYYESSGVLRDMFQNHLMQLLALTAMEPAASFDADAIRNEKVKIFQSIQPLTPKDISNSVILGQYRGYRHTSNVKKDSSVPTYAALRLFIDNWRWQGVPFYLRSGKALKEKVSEIILQFKNPPHIMFPLKSGEAIKPNILGICIQPDEGMHLQYQVKIPDTMHKTRSVHMMYHYKDDFGPSMMPKMISVPP